MESVICDKLKKNHMECGTFNVRKIKTEMNK